MATANDRLYDLSLRHQIDLRRFTTGEVKRVMKILEQIDAEATAKLRRDLAALVTGAPLQFTPEQEKRLKAILADVQLVRSAGWKQVRGELGTTMEELAVIEAQVEVRSIQSALPVVVAVNGVEVSTLRAVAMSKPFQGKLLKEWFDGLEVMDAHRLSQAVRLGLAQGEDLNSIVRRIVGSRANKYTDGVLTMSRRNAEAIVRTAANHTSNVAREEVWARNADIISGLRWTATLDGRTSSVCRARDGMVAPFGEGKLPSGSTLLVPNGARPPAHLNCRSTMVPVLAGERIVGERATVRDTRTGKEMQKDFRAEAKAKAGNRWTHMTEEQRRASTKRVKDAWASEHIGHEPSTTNYDQWLRKQPAAFQDEVLGNTKGALFRRGGLTLDQYIDREGNELTINQLRDKFPDAFEQANVA